MNMKLIECVANFSEGQNRTIIDAVAASIENCSSGQQQVNLLHVDSNSQANRTVITFAGAPKAVLEAAKGMSKIIFNSIDMQKHKGEHPRLGALDVCPFVPLWDVSIQEANLLALEFGKYIGDTFSLPIFLYRESAQTSNRVHLADIRRGEYEGLIEKLEKPEWKPDFGPSILNLALGATVVGVREILVAWNINLATNDLKIARKIAKAIRGRFSSVRSIAWNMDKEFGHAQVSCNLENFRSVNIASVYKFAKELVSLEATTITGSELIGLAPIRAFNSEAETPESALRAARELGMREIGESKLLECVLGAKIKHFEKLVL